MSQLPITTVLQGDTVRLPFAVQDYNGAAQDLTGCEIRWGYADLGTSPTPLLTKTDVDGVTIADAGAGLLQVNVAAGELDTPGTFTQELEITLPSGPTYTYAQGLLVVKPTVYPEQA